MNAHPAAQARGFFEVELWHLVRRFRSRGTAHIGAISRIYNVAGYDSRQQMSESARRLKTKE